MKLCNVKEISIIIGLQHYFINDYVENYTLIYDYSLNFAFLKRKNHFAYHEIKARIGKKFKNREELNMIVDNGLFKYSVLTCFDLTSIKTRADLSDKIDLLFLPVFNQDTSYFSSIIESYTREAFCFIAQANVNSYGDSMVTSPQKNYMKNMVKLKGGENNFFVLCSLKIKELIDIKSKAYESLKKQNISEFYKVFEENDTYHKLCASKKIIGTYEYIKSEEGDI